MKFLLVWLEQAWQPHYCKLMCHQIWSLLSAILLSQWNQNLPIFEPSSSTASLSSLRKCCLRSCLSSVLLLSSESSCLLVPKGITSDKRQLFFVNPARVLHFRLQIWPRAKRFSFTWTYGWRHLSLCVWCESILVPKMYVSTMSLVRAELAGFRANARRRQARRVSGTSRAHSQNARVLLEFRILDVLEIYLSAGPKRDHLRAPCPSSMLHEPASIEYTFECVALI